MKILRLLLFLTSLKSSLMMHNIDGLEYSQKVHRYLLMVELYMSQVPMV
nr:MAG TPA: hypothetical protein [Caudoviricetes sp.]